MDGAATCRARAVRQRHQARQKPGERLAGARRRDQQGRAALGHICQKAELVRAGCQPRRLNQSRNGGGSRAERAAHAWVGCPAVDCALLRHACSQPRSIRGQPRQNSAVCCAMQDYVKGAGAQAQQIGCEGTAAWIGSNSSVIVLRALLVRLVLLSIVVGIVFSVLGITPFNLIERIEQLVRRMLDLGLDAFHSAFGYFLLGAVVVIPVCPLCVC